MLLLAGSSGCGGTDKPKDNGEQSKPAKQVAVDAAAAVDRGGSVHLVSNQAANSFDIRVQKPDDAMGSIVLSGDKAELRATGNQVFFRADAAFYRASGKSSATAGASTWLRLAEGLKDDKDLGSFSFSGALQQLHDPSGTTYDPTVKPTDVDGRPALQLTTADGTQLFVSSVGDPLPLRVIEKSEDGTTATTDFSDFGQRFTVDVPKTYVQDASTAG